MKTLLLLRHGKSSWSDPSLADIERPLKKRGRRDAARVGVFLAARDALPDAIVSSPARRAIETARLFAEACDYGGAIVEAGDLYGAGPGDVLYVARQVDPFVGRLMIVGHNPCLEELWFELTGEDERMPTAALAEVRLWLDDWRRLDSNVESEAVGLWTPAEMDASAE